MDRYSIINIAKRADETPRYVVLLNGNPMDGEYATYGEAENIVWSHGANAAVRRIS